MVNFIKKWMSILLVLIVAAAVFAILPGEPVQAAKPGGIQCPQIWAPVICRGDKIYPNQCFADKAHAKDCVPYGDI